MFTGLLDSTTLKLQLHLEKLEVRLGLLGASICVSLFLLFLAGIYCAPAFELINHGMDYGGLALNPLDVEAGNRFQNRILTPILGFLLFLKGPAFIVLPLLFATAFISALYFHCRSLSIDAASVLGICCLIVFSSPILYTLHFAGYVDTTSYFLLFLCYIFRKQPIRVFLCYSLALLNHESNAFAMPWIILLSGYQSNASGTQHIKTGVAAVLAFVPFLMMRHLFADSATHLQFDFYLNKSNLADSLWLQRDNLYYGIFQGFKLFWCFPIVATLLALKNKKFHTALLITGIVGCAGAQLLIAADTSRLMGLAFPAILIGAIEVWKYLKGIQFRRILLLLIIANVIIPQAFVGYGVIVPFHSLPVALYMKFYMGVDVWETAWI